MRIENFGLPGSGKSTLSGAVSKRLAAKGLVTVDPAGLDALDAAHLTGHRRIWHDTSQRQSFHIARYLQDYGQFHNLCTALYGTNTRNLGLLLCVGADMARHNRVAGHLHSFWADEGFLHLGVHALMEATGWQYNQCAGPLADFLNAIPRPDAVLYVRTSVEQATEGIFQRMLGKSPEQATRRFHNAFGGPNGMAARAMVIEDVAAWMQKNGVPVITVPGHTDFEALATKVLTDIQRIQKPTTDGALP